jgi:hypothetical protein
LEFGFKEVIHENDLLGLSMPHKQTLRALLLIFFHFQLTKIEYFSLKNTKIENRKINIFEQKIKKFNIFEPN